MQTTVENKQKLQLLCRWKAMKSQHAALSAETAWRSGDLRVHPECCTILKCVMAATLAEGK